MLDGEVFIRLIDFPTCACGGFVIPNDDGTYSVYLNSRLSRQQNVESMEHELLHIKKDDLYRNVPVQVIERDAV